METSQESIKEEYKTHLNPHKFKEFKLEGLKSKKWQDNYDFWFTCLSDFFSSGDFSGDRLLDVGSGPTVHNVALASFHFSHIVLSDFVEANCEELRKWLKKNPECMDWFPFLSRVARIEKQENVHDTCEKMEEQIRSSVKAVTVCDVLNEDIIAKEYCKEPFDLILSSLTLETAAVDFQSFCKCLGRIKRLLRRDGKLILISLTQCSGWYVNGRKLNFLSLTEDDIQKALEINGFRNIKWKFRKQPDDGLPFYCDKVYFVSCTNN